MIVGAGPAGSVAAKKLSDYGFTVSLYEKERLPRHKHCAGYISQMSLKALDSIGVDCRDVLRHRIRGFRIRSGEEVLDFEFHGSENSLPGNVYREEFDFFLIQHAVESGAKIIDSNRVVKIVMNKEEEKYSVITQKGREECDIILGADGANSMVRRYLGIHYPKNKLAVTIEGEVSVGENISDFYDDNNFCDFSCVQRGYGWAYPKREGKTINVGIIVSVEEAKKMHKSLLGVWREFLQTQGWYKNQSVQPHGSILPYQGTVDKLGYKKILLLGDAAGFVEPVGGEGIPYAIESSLNAAEAIKLHLEEKSILLDTYTVLMKDILDEINFYGMKMHKNFFIKNRINTFLKMTKKSEYVHNMMSKIVSRSLSYKQTMESFSLLRFILAYLKMIF